MKSTITLCAVPLFAAALLAQGPPGGRGFGLRGLEGPGGFAGRGAGILGAGPGSRTPVTGAPYSATETVQRQQTLANGNEISTKGQSTVYRDSEGRIRTEETITPSASSGKAAYTMVTIFDPVAGYRYVLDSSTMIARQSTLPKSTGTSNTRPSPPARPNVTTTSLGTSVINGVAATGTQLTETIPAGAIGNAQAIQVIRITWISTELKVPVEIKTTDPRYGNTDMELTNIAQTEPSGALFLVPAGYTIQQGGGRGNGGRGPGGSARSAARRGQNPQ
jgi:hypothetical protein